LYFVFLPVTNQYFGFEFFGLNFLPLFFSVFGVFSTHS